MAIAESPVSVGKKTGKLAPCCTAVKGNGFRVGDMLEIVFERKTPNGWTCGVPGSRHKCTLALEPNCERVPVQVMLPTKAVLPNFDPDKAAFYKVTEVVHPMASTYLIYVEPLYLVPLEFDVVESIKIFLDMKRLSPKERKEDPQMVAGRRRARLEALIQMARTKLCDIAVQEHIQNQKEAAAKASSNGEGAGLVPQGDIPSTQHVVAAQ